MKQVCLLMFVVFALEIASVPQDRQPSMSNQPYRKLTNAQKMHLLDGNFSIISKTEQLPNVVQTALAKVLHQKTLSLANPDQRFNASDVGAPNRRLLFAGTSDEKSFVHYESGGIAHVFTVVVFQTQKPSPAKVLWIGSGFHARSLDQLRTAVANGKFKDVTGAESPD